MRNISVKLFPIKTSVQELWRLFCLADCADCAISVEGIIGNNSVLSF